MKTHAVMLTMLAACPSGNPSRLWLAPDQMETAVKLQDTKPRAF